MDKTQLKSLWNALIVSPFTPATRELFLESVGKGGVTHEDTEALDEIVSEAKARVAKADDALANLRVLQLEAPRSAQGCIHDAMMLVQRHQGRAEDILQQAQAASLVVRFSLSDGI